MLAAEVLRATIFGSHTHHCPDCKRLWTCYQDSDCQPELTVCVDCADFEEVPETTN